MTRVPAIALLLFLAAALPCICRAQIPEGFFYEGIDQVIPGSPPGNVQYDFASDSIRGTNILIQYRGATLMADSIIFTNKTQVAVADGHVRIEQAGEVWIGDHVVYNFPTRQLSAGPFRTGKAPEYAQGDGIDVSTSKTNEMGTAHYVRVTSDNISRPAYYVRASRMTMVPGKYFEAWNAVVYVEGVPVFYYPYYRRNLELHANTISLTPGDESMYGPYLLGYYTWWLNDEVDGKLHLDYRVKRGFAGGPDLNLHLGRWGTAQLKYYYLYDQDPGDTVNTATNYSNLGTIHHNRQRFYMSWQATPYTNLDLKALVNYQSDQLLLHDFFQGDYGQNPQPITFVEANRYWDNWNVNVLTVPRINDFFDQVQRLPDIQLTGYRQQIFNTPLYYESQSSAGYYERYFASTNTLFGQTNGPIPNFAATRVDTFHQLLLPETFFGWLNVTPRVGGRATWYSSESGPGGTNSQTTRAVFNTGVDVSFKASQLWPDATNAFLDINGLRHIIMPTITYAYVPTPNLPPYKVPQFDTQLPSLMILPVEFPDYNDIDDIYKENVIRWGIRNTLQTKRDGQLDTLLDWNVMLDWNLKPDGQTNSVFLQPQKTFDDLYSDLTFKPRSWITFDSQIRYSINNGYINLAFHQITFTPNDRWSWSVGNWYLHDGFVDSGDDVITSTFFYRLNDNWGLRASHYFNAEDGRLQEQDYSLYRDLRSFTAAVTFRLIDNGGGQPLDYGFAFSLSLKAVPRFHLGDDTVRSYQLLGE